MPPLGADADRQESVVHKPPDFLLMILIIMMMMKMMMMMMMMMMVMMIMIKIITMLMMLAWSLYSHISLQNSFGIFASLLF